MSQAEDRFLERLERRPNTRRRPTPRPEYDNPSHHPRDLYDPSWLNSKDGLTEVRGILKAERARLNLAIQAVERGGSRILSADERAKVEQWTSNLRWIHETLGDLYVRYNELDALTDARMREFSRRFLWHAKRTLDAATFEAICQKAEVDATAELEAMEARRKLGVGAALGVRAATASPKSRDAAGASRPKGD